MIAKLEIISICDTFFGQNKINDVFLQSKAVGRSVACMFRAGGKSGQHRASYFLTESCP